MVTRVNEPIKVLAAFGEKRLHIKPLQLVWKDATYKLGPVDFFHATHKGAERVYHFSLCDAQAGMYMKLAFYTHSLKWVLEEIEAEVWN